MKTVKLSNQQSQNVMANVRASSDAAALYPALLEILSRLEEAGLTQNAKKVRKLQQRLKAFLLNLRPEVLELLLDGATQDLSHRWLAATAPADEFGEGTLEIHIALAESIEKKRSVLTFCSTDSSSMEH